MKSIAPLALAACLLPTLANAQIITPGSPVSETTRLRERLRTEIDVLQGISKEAATAGLEAPAVTTARQTLITQKQAELTKAETTTNKGADFLRQGGFNFGTGASEISIQAADLYFTRSIRFFLRSTLPVKKEEGGEEAAEPGTTPTIDENIKAALGNPYGGLVYATIGYVPRLHVKGVSLGRTEPDYGVFLDMRAGFKAIEIPKEKAATDGKFEVTPFYTSSVGLRVQMPLFNNAAVDAKAGDFGFAASWVWNAVSDLSVSDLFKADATGAVALERHVQALHVAVGIVLSDVAYLSLEGTPKTNSNLGTRWMVGLNLLRN